jgi:hypothetical protein
MLEFDSNLFLPNLINDFNFKEMSRQFETLSSSNFHFQQLSILQLLSPFRGVTPSTTLQPSSIAFHLFFITLMSFPYRFRSHLSAQFVKVCEISLNDF